MRIITEPKVYILARQVINYDELDRFLADLGVDWDTDTTIAAEVITETAGRLCYLSFARPRPGGNRTYLDHIKEAGHGSVLEHAVWSILITNVSRSLTHELVRHRAGMSFSQLSQRYVDESVAEYIEPDIIADDPDLHALWTAATRSAHDSYLTLVDALTKRLHDHDSTASHHLPPYADKTTKRKAVRQAARSLLPNSTETKIILTANARSLRHFIELRSSAAADPEIRKLANTIYERLLQESPNIFGDYTRNPLPDGTYELITPYQKV